MQSKRDVEFKRLCGVKRHTFGAIRQALARVAARKRKPGRPGALSLEDQLLLTLLDWRQYGTLLHLGAAVGISEGTASRRVRWVEDVLVKSGHFTLPARRTRLAPPARKRPGVALEATASPVERPKKNSAASLAASASVIP